MGNSGGSGTPPPSRPTPRRTDTRDPRRSRERALKILFQADIRGVPPAVTLERVESDPVARAMLDDADDLRSERELLGRGGPGSSRRGGSEIDGFTRSLVLGVAEHNQEIDALISRFARRWQISRMPVVDRTVLRLATFELLYESTPHAVAIHEAVELAKALSTEDSGRYVNGVLESIRREVAAHAAERPQAAAGGPRDGETVEDADGAERGTDAGDS